MHVEFPRFLLLCRFLGSGTCLRNGPLSVWNLTQAMNSIIRQPAPDGWPPGPKAK